jgi:hypothetical protein
MGHFLIKGHRGTLISKTLVFNRFPCHLLQLRLFSDRPVKQSPTTTRSTDHWGPFLIVGNRCTVMPSVSVTEVLDSRKHSPLYMIDLTGFLKMMYRAPDIFLSVFRSKLSEEAGLDSVVPGYGGILDIACRMNRRYSREEVQAKALQVLVNLFPSWMPPAYKAIFSTPFPKFSARMNAWATWVAGTWLMGECEINDVEVLVHLGPGDATGKAILKNQGLRVARCRFLEEAGCASVCVHSCQIPTQRFFSEHMGLPLLMEPNYETFECQFSFGISPTAGTERAARNTPCLARCPSSGSLRLRHTSSLLSGENESGEGEVHNQTDTCSLMED